MQLFLNSNFKRGVDFYRHLLVFGSNFENTKVQEPIISSHAVALELNLCHRQRSKSLAKMVCAIRTCHVIETQQAAAAERKTSCRKMTASIDVHYYNPILLYIFLKK